MRRAALLGLEAAALLLVACGGGSSSESVRYGSVSYAATVVSIKRLDLSSVAISAASIANPPNADQYPTVVAEVNGKPITGKQLAAELLSLELARRSRLKVTPNAYYKAYANSQLHEATSADPLTLTIDEELRRQAVDRLGLLPSRDDAVTYVRQLEGHYAQDLAQASAEKRAQVLDMLRQDGFPASNWASDDRIVQAYTEQLGLAKLLHQVCPKYDLTPTSTPAITGFVNIFSTGESCAAFLAQQRKSANIVYYVRWAD